MASLQERLEARRAEFTPPDLGTEPAPQAPKSLSQRLQERRQQMEQGTITTSPQEQDRQAREQALAGQVGQTTLGEAGLPNLGARADIALSDTFDEKHDKFMAKFPDGDFTLVNSPSGGQTILFRRNQDEPFAEFDPDLLEKFEFAGDLADLAGEVPSVTMEAIITRGGGLVKQALQIFTGAVAGEGLKETVESLRGFQNETFGEVATRAVTKGAIGAAGGVATIAVSGPLNSLRGAGVIKIAPGARAAQTAAKELGIPALLPNQVAQSPVIRKIGGQASATVSTIGEYIRNQNAAAVNALMRLRNEDITKILKGELTNLHNAAKGQLLNVARRSVNLSEAGTAIQSGIVEYDNLARAVINKAYSNARAVETPEFDISAAQQIAKQIKAGVRGQTVKGKELRLSEIDPDLEAAIDDLISLNPSLPEVPLPDGVATGTEQLRAIQQRLWDLKTPAPGEIMRSSHKDAAKVYAAITHVQKNPENADEAFVKAWADANSLAASRFDTMEKLIIIQAARSETPAQLANRLAKPLQVDNLKLLKDTLPAGQWDTFQRGVVTDMLAPQNIDNLSRRLSSFDKETLDFLMTPGDQSMLGQIGREIDRLNQLNIPGILQRQAQTGAIVRDLVMRKDTAAIDTLVQRAGKNPDTPVRTSLRAGIMENIIGDVVGRAENEVFIDNAALTSILSGMRETGAIRLLTGDDVRVLNNLEKVAGFLPKSADSGTSIQAASTAAGLRELSVTAFVTLLETVGTGRFFTSKMAQRMILGTGKDSLSFPGLRVTGATLAQIAADLEAEQGPQ